MVDANTSDTSIQSDPTSGIGDPAAESQSMQTQGDLRYGSVVGRLQYLLGGSRPDLSTATRILSCHQRDHTLVHWRMARKVLRFVKHTQSDGLIYDLHAAANYCVDSKLKVEVAADADFANVSMDRKSVTGYAVFYNGQLICAKSRKQEIITESTMNLSRPVKHFAKPFGSSNSSTSSTSRERSPSSTATTAALRASSTTPRSISARSTLQSSTSKFAT